MPLVYQQNINEHSRLGIWHITEDESFFAEHVPLQRSITHPHKRLQHFAGRYLLKIMFPDFPLSLILIADTKKPFLQNEAYHFSISHCGDYAAVMVSNKNRVGVDIEIIQPKLEKIKRKFLSAEELNAIEPVNLKSLTLAWSCKEALFKWYGLGNVEFKTQLQLENIIPIEAAGIVEGSIKKESTYKLKVYYKFFETLCLSWICS
ncbi:MAG: 4'-phosphopantetheinyl transferase superfamily protein [Ferruginibacter sp.]